jgi:hypothetical protein
MIGMEELTKVFNDKLVKTGSLDAAFTKSHWVTFKKGYEIGYAAAIKDTMGTVQNGVEIQDRFDPKTLGRG